MPAPLPSRPTPLPGVLGIGDHLRGIHKGLAAIGLLALVACAQDSLPIKHENIIGRWRSESGWFTFSFYSDGRFEKQERGKGRTLLTGGLFMLDSESQWSVSDDRLTVGVVLFEVRRLTADRMVIQFGDDPPIKLKRLETDRPGLNAGKATN